MSSSAHPADGELRALLDGELPATRRLDVEQHPQACAACRDRLRALESTSQETRALLDLLPAAAPDLRIDVIVRRGRRTRLRLSPIAAAIALVVATAAGATVGRPYLRSLLARIRAVVRPTSPPPLEPPAHGQGIAFVPGPSAEITFDTRQAAGALYVSLADTTELAIDPTASVTYRVHPGGVIVHNRGSEASYDIIVPRGAPHVRILVSGRVLFEKVGSGISATAGAESIGRYVITLQ